MKFNPKHYLQRSNDSVMDFRNNVYMLFGFSTVPALIPFSLKNFLQGNVILGVLILLVIIPSVTNSLFIVRNGRAFIQFEALYCLIIVVLLLAIAIMGPIASLWCYPLAFVTLFIIEQHKARIVTVAGIILIIPCAFLYMPTDFAIRFSITYFISCIFGDFVISLLSDLQTQLKELAITDPLTGAYNRRHMKMCLSDAIEEHQRALNAVSIIAIDIDHFKDVNDSLGHEAGDQILQDLVEVIQKRIRKTDIVFRIGGEEFLVLTRNIHSEQTNILAEDLRNNIEQAELLKDRPLTVSLGVAHYKGDEEITSWLRRADENLYKAKRHGRNQAWPKQ